jgi:hypothetical protein
LHPDNPQDAVSGVSVFSSQIACLHRLFESAFTPVRDRNWELHSVANGQQINTTRLSMLRESFGGKKEESSQSGYRYVPLGTCQHPPFETVKSFSATLTATLPASIKNIMWFLRDSFSALYPFGGISTMPAPMNGRLTIFPYLKSAPSTSWVVTELAPNARSCGILLVVLVKTEGCSQEI